jgi:hypothetical protein
MINEVAAWLEKKQSSKYARILAFFLAVSAGVPSA